MTSRFFAFTAGSRGRASALLLGSLLVVALVAVCAYTASTAGTPVKKPNATAAAPAPAQPPAAPTVGRTHDVTAAHATRDTQPAGDVQTSKIWKPGQEWSTTVWENTAGVAPTGGTSQWYATTFAFRLESAPTTRRGDWLVLAHRDGAEGPFAAGWELTYRRTDSGAMRLTGVAMADGPSYAPRYADVVLGSNFPLQPTISKPVRNGTLRLR